MSAQPFNASDFKKGYTAAGAPRQMSRRADDTPRTRMPSSSNQADTTMRASAPTQGSEARTVEEWASDCLTDCYNC